MPAWRHVKLKKFREVIPSRL